MMDEPRALAPNTGRGPLTVFRGQPPMMLPVQRGEQQRGNGEPSYGTSFLMLRDCRFAGAQSSDLFLGVDMGDAQRPPSESRLISLEELCARDNPLRSQVANFDCDKWKKSRSGK